MIDEQDLRRTLALLKAMPDGVGILITRPIAQKGQALCINPWGVTVLLPEGGERQEPSYSATLTEALRNAYADALIALAKQVRPPG